MARGKKSGLPQGAAAAGEPEKTSPRLPRPVKLTVHGVTVQMLVNETGADRATVEKYLAAGLPSVVESVLKALLRERKERAEKDASVAHQKLRALEGEGEESPAQA